MSVELETALTIATHMAELVGAHGLVEAGKAPVKRIAQKAVGWLRVHLPPEDQTRVTAAIQNPGPGQARVELTSCINSLLVAQSELLTELRDMLAETREGDGGQHQAVGDNSLGVQIRGSGNVIKR